MNRQKFVGTVVKAPFARGSKSEHGAVMLEAGDERYVLRRVGGNAFRDPDLEGLIGKRIECTGQVDGYTLHFDMKDCAELPQKG